MASQKISELSALTSVASGDYFPLVQDSDTSNKRVGIDVLDGRYAATSSGALAHEALASGNAALSYAVPAFASGNAALTDAEAAQASGNAALTTAVNKYDKTGGPITGFVKTQSQVVGEIDTTALTSGVIILDFSASNNFDITLGGNSTLASPTTPSGGQTGNITIRQDSNGSRTLAYSGDWNFAAGAAPTLTTSASGVDVICYYVSSPTEIQAASILDLR